MQTIKKRYYWVDAAKAIGIFLIFQAHILQRAYRSSTIEIFWQYKFIYAFHLPLFFFISGFFYKNRDIPKLEQIGVLFQKRIFPVALFAALTLAFSVPYQYLKFGTVDAAYYVDNLLYLLQGKPHLSATLWFLVCLWLVEIWAVTILPTVKTNLHGILLSVFFLYFGYVWSATPELETFYLLPKNFWYLHETLIAFGFYVAGYTSFKWVGRLLQTHAILRFSLMVPLFGLSYWAAQINMPYKGFVVVMKASEHGDLLPFLLSAFAGTLATLLLASFIPHLKWVDYIGKNTLVLLGMNGLFMSFFNSHILAWLNHYDSTAWMTFDSIWVSVLTIALSVPAIELLNRYLPQFIGRPQADGPWLKAFKPFELRLLDEIYKKITQKFGTIHE